MAKVSAGFGIGGQYYWDCLPKSISQQSAGISMAFGKIRGHSWVIDNSFSYSYKAAQKDFALSCAVNLLPINILKNSQLFIALGGELRMIFGKVYDLDMLKQVYKGKETIDDLKNDGQPINVDLAYANVIPAFIIPIGYKYFCKDNAEFFVQATFKIGTQFLMFKGHLLKTQYEDFLGTEKDLKKDECSKSFYFNVGFSLGARIWIVKKDKA